MTSVYRRFTNKQLHDMIEKLLEVKIINEKQAEKFKWSEFKRHHERRLLTDEDRKESNRESALKSYYRNRLLVIWRKYCLKK